MTGLTHVRLVVDDFAPMLAFYRDVLGFAVVVDVPGTYVELDTGAARIGLCARSLMESVVGTGLRTTSGGDSVLQVAVADVDAAAALVRGRGVEPLTVPHDQRAWGLRICHLRDPASRLIELTTPLGTPR